MAEPNQNSLSEERTLKLDHHEKSKTHHHKETHGTSDDIDQNTAIDDVKGPGIFERVKEEIEAMGGHHEKSKSHHHKETHGTSDDIDQNTDIDDVKGPGFFHRVKEEIEAVVDAVIPHHSSKK